jgi:hypothetical protein
MATRLRSNWGRMLGRVPRFLLLLSVFLAVACTDRSQSSRATPDACADLPEITQVVGADHEVLVYEAADGNRYTVKDTDGRVVATCASSDDFPWSFPDSARTVVRMLERPDFGYVQ